MIASDDPDDPAFDPHFKPCRNERCKIHHLHAEHPVVSGRGRRNHVPKSTVNEEETSA